VQYRLNVNCTIDEDCPNHTNCGMNDYFPHNSYCESQNCYGLCMAKFYCKKNKSVCSFNYDKEEGIRYISYISQSKNIFGLDYSEDCRYDRECIDGRCRHKNFWGIGSCGEPSDSDSFSGIGFLIFAVIMILIIASICFCTCVVSCIQNSENHKREKMGLEKKKSKALKFLIISCVTALSILILFFIIRAIDKSLN